MSMNLNMNDEQNFSIGDGAIGREESGSVGITVLLVDSDSMCLAIVSKILHASGYRVVTATHAAEAMRILQERENGVNLVLTEIHLPDMDKYELLEIMGEICSIPIVVMSVDHDENTMLGCLFKGAAFYLPKPISLNDIKNLWQFSYMKKNHEENVDLEESTICEEGSPFYNSSNEESDCVSFCSALEQNAQKGKRKAPEEMGRDNDNSGFPKKPKLIWTDELHHRFLQAIRTIGIDNAHPKNILKHMNVPGLKKENISSHLQKYRNSVKCDQNGIETTHGGYHISPLNVTGETLEFQKPQLLMTSNPEFHVKNHNNLSRSIPYCLGSTNHKISKKNDEVHSTCSSKSNGMKSCNHEDFGISGTAVEKFGFEDVIDNELLGDSLEKQQEFVLPPLSPLMLEQQRNEVLDAEIGDFEHLFDMPTWSDDIFQDHDFFY